MPNEPHPKVNVPGTGAVGVGRDVIGSTINIRTEIHTHAPAPESPHRLRSIPFPPLGDQFARRREILTSLEALLLPPAAAATSLRRAAAVKSDGGMGKTSLAVELGHRLFAEGKFDYVLFLNATSASDLDLDLSSLCARARLNLPEQSAQDQATRLAGVLAFLADPANAARTLLLLDGADCDEAAQRVRQLHAELAGCALLVTSRQSIGGRIKEHRLDYFRPEESREFLRSRLEDTGLAGTGASGSEALDRIAEALDHFPLALEIAASQIRDLHQSPPEWLVEWKKGATEFYEYHNPAHTDYPLPLVRVWESSFVRLSADAQKQLQLLAWLAPRPAALPVAPLKHLDNWSALRTWLADEKTHGLDIPTSPQTSTT